MQKKIKYCLLTTTIILLYCFLFIPNNLAIPCLFYKLTNLYCPGCGLTRMLISLIHLDFYQAFRYNPLLFCYLPFIMILTIDFICKWIQDKQNYLYTKIPNFIYLVLIFLTIGFGLLRNIPQFSYLKPTVITNDFSHK